MTTADNSQSSSPTPDQSPSLPDSLSDNMADLPPVPPPVAMPACTDWAAPKFDLAVPRTLNWYIDDIDHFFTQAYIADNQQKKKYFTTYVLIQEQDIFNGLAEYGVNLTYAEFVSKYHREYLAVAGYLLLKQKIGTAEQSQSFI